MVAGAFDRVHALSPGEGLRVGDRTLRAVVPPTFDNPMSIGLHDESTGTLFSVDSFGAILPVAREAADVPEEALVGGMVAWGTFDSPWTQRVLSTLPDAEPFVAPDHAASSTCSPR